MSRAEDDPRGIRGDELAYDAASETDVPPNADPFGADGVRGDGLAEGADAGAAPDADEAAKDGVRGDGLATDA